ncbi:MAG: hypothetical protein V4671_04935 [Armatimonadota bacterium]
MFWKKQKQAASPPSEETVVPEIIDVIPGTYAVHVYQHDLPTISGTIPCLTYRSMGLSRLKQQEVGLTLIRRQDAPAPPEPLHFFRMLYQLAQQGMIVEAGQWTQFGEKRFLDRHLVYVPAQTIATLPTVPNSLMAISVTENELIDVQRFGILRLMARLSHQARYYPCPPWLDPARADTSVEPDQTKSILAHTPCLRIPQVRVLRLPGKVVLQLPSRRRTYLAEKIREMDESAQIVFLTTLDEKADGCLVWEEGQAEVAAVTPPKSAGERLSGCFIILLPDQGTAGCRPVEDGIAAFSTREQWQQIRRTLCDGRSLEMKADDGYLPLRIEWD